MKRLLALAIAAGFLPLLAGPAAAATFPRHLVFKAGVDVKTQQDTLTSGMGGQSGGADSTSGINAGSNVAHSSGALSAQGTLEVDILGVDPANVLVADITEKTDNRREPTVRAIVSPDGLVQIGDVDAGNISDEERILLQWLGQKILSPARIARGKWTNTVSVPRQTLDSSYQITGTTPTGALKINVDENMKVQDVRPYDVVVHGTVVYDPNRTVPNAISFMMRSHEEGLQTTTTVDTTIDLNLLSDSGS